MPARSYVINSRKRLDAFLASGDRLNRIELRVGILSGAPRYPKGHVGAKSRIDNPDRQRIDPRELQRRGAMRELRKSLKGLDAKTRKQAVKEIRAAFRADGISTKGLATKRSGKGVQVAKVAGVIHAGSPYHVAAMDSRRGDLRRELEAVVQACLDGRNAADIVRGIGQRSRDKVRQELTKTTHVDTRRLWKTTQFEIIDRTGQAFARKQAKARRRAAAARRARRRKRGAK